MAILIIGSTGTLGRQIVRKALNEGFHVKCLVRNLRKAAFLKEWGAELLYGDLTLPETIPLTMYGVTAVIDASTARSTDLTSIIEIDLQGKYILIESAIKAQIKHYIFFSILNAYKYKDIPLIHLKLLIEKKLSNSNLNYTIFNLSGFFQGLISQYTIPLLDQKSIWITGESTSINYISSQDAAAIAIKSLSISQAKNKNFPLVGNKSWTSLQIIELCEKISGKRASISRIPISALKILKEIFRCFQWSWNISERLAFIEILSRGDNFNASMEEVYQLFHIKEEEIESLETYFQEYFIKIMKKLKELNSQVLNDKDTTPYEF